MINISLDLGNIPSVLAALSDPRIAQNVANVAAESFVDDIHDWIDAGRAFTPREGHLQQSIGWHGNGDGSSSVYANAEYAGFVENGTGPHVIAPKDGRGGLRFPAGGAGGFIIRRSVNHPGSKAHPFFFTDLADRNQHMQDKAMLVLARAMINDS